MTPQRTINCTPSGSLCRYGERQFIERALTLGEFMLKPASSFRDKQNDVARQDDELVRTRHTHPDEIKIILQRTGQEIQPIGPVTFQSKSLTDYLIVCFSQKWDPMLFAEFQHSDSCLVINNVVEFQNRFHAAVEMLLPDWTGMDIAVEYGTTHPLGMWFSKPASYAQQEEWRFAWRPKVRTASLGPTLVTIGSIADIAEIRYKPA